jgi:hypothetical protein
MASVLWATDELKPRGHGEQGEDDGNEPRMDTELHGWDFLGSDFGIFAVTSVRVRLVGLSMTEV